MNRRAHDRHRIGRAVRSVRVGTVSEAPLPGAELIDTSAGGLLVAFAEPIGLLPRQRVCLSLDLRDGALHLMARVARIERGDDFRTYVGMVVDEPADSGVAGPELERWRDWIERECHELVSSRRSA